jgi:hypothetical protein
MPTTKQDGHSTPHTADPKVAPPRLVRTSLAETLAVGDNPNDKSCTVTFTSPVAVSPPQTLTLQGVTYNVCTGTFTYSMDPIQFPAKTNAKIKFDLANNSASGWQLCKFSLLGNPNGSDGLPGVVYADANKKITVTDDNQGATTVTFDYGILVINPTTLQCAGSDPQIINDGGGTGGDKD